MNHYTSIVVVNGERDPRPQVASGGRFRFGLLSLLLAVTLLSVAAALLGNLLRGPGGGLHAGAFVLLAAAAPMGLMIAISLARLIARTRRR